MTEKSPWPHWLHAANDGADSLVDVSLAGADGRRTCRECRLIGEAKGRLLVQLGVDAANDNDALVRFLSETLGVSLVQISIVGGAKSVRKTVRLSGVGHRQALLRLAP